jgi:hypothetical protein
MKLAFVFRPVRAHFEEAGVHLPRLELPAALFWGKRT